MSEDEVNERFEEVLQDAYLADMEAEEAAIEGVRAEFTELLDSGRVPVHVLDIDGCECVAIPTDIMRSMVEALKEYTEFAAELNYQLEMGNAAVLIGEMLSDAQIQSLVTKCTFITLAVVNHHERNGIVE